MAQVRVTLTLNADDRHSAREGIAAPFTGVPWLAEHSSVD
jgi:hypothetical protein